MIVWYGSFSRTVLNVFCKSFFTLVRWALFFMCSVFYVFLTFEFRALFCVFCCLFVTSVLRTVFNVFCWIVCHVSSSDTVLHVFCLIVCHVSSLRTVLYLFCLIFLVC